jgi:AcrR family transcriptional regulator
VPRPRFDNIDPKKKDQLLDAAVKEFARHGYELASVNRILQTAGLSKGSFYYYFDDKADLAATAFLSAAEPIAFLDELGEPSSAAAFWKELRRVSYQRLQLLESKRTQFECVARLSSALGSDPALAARVLPRFEPGRRKMARFLEKGVALGALRNDLPVGTLMAMLEAIKKVAYQAEFADERVPTEVEMESFTDLIIDCARRLATPARSQPRKKKGRSR